MGVIQCCGGLQKAKSYFLQPSENFIEVRMDWLEACPHCSHTIIQLTRIDFDNRISVVRKVNLKARKLREKLENDIITEIKERYNFATAPMSNFYLYYNDFGKKKKCFSNLSCLKMGLGENLDFALNTCILKN